MKKIIGSQRSNTCQGVVSLDPVNFSIDACDIQLGESFAHVIISVEGKIHIVKFCHACGKKIARSLSRTSFDGTFAGLKRTKCPTPLKVPR